MPVYLIVDIQRMRQIFLNLLQNAIKFTYSGKITVTLEYDY